MNDIKFEEDSEEDLDGSAPRFGFDVKKALNGN